MLDFVRLSMNIPFCYSCVFQRTGPITVYQEELLVPSTTSMHTVQFKMCVHSFYACCCLRVCVSLCVCVCVDAYVCTQMKIAISFWFACVFMWGCVFAWVGVWIGERICECG